MFKTADQLPVILITIIDTYFKMLPLKQKKGHNQLFTQVESKLQICQIKFLMAKDRKMNLKMQF